MNKEGTKEICGYTSCNSLSRQSLKNACQLQELSLPIPVPTCSTSQEEGGEGREQFSNCVMWVPALKALMNSPAAYDPSEMRYYLMENEFTDLLLLEKATTLGLGHFLVDTLRKMWQKKELFDYTIYTESKSFQVHKVILAIFSDYFRRMFSGSMKESKENSIELKGITASGLEPIIKLIYEGECLEVNERNIVDVLNTASFLHMPVVMHLCVDKIGRMIDADNCVDILNLVFMYSLHGSDLSLDEKALFCFQENWKKIIQERHTRRLYHDALSFVLSNSLVGVSDYDLFCALQDWVLHNISGGEATSCQKDKIFEMLKGIHFPLMSKQELSTILETCPFIMSDARCCQLVAEAQIYQSQPVPKRVLNDSPRTTIMNDPCIFSFSGNIIDEETDLPTDTLNSDCFAFVESSGKWLQIHNKGPEFAISRAAFTVVNNFLIVCGGYGNKSTVGDECYVYDPRFSKWTGIAPMNCVRHSFSVVYCSQVLYAIGGTCNDSIEIYDFETNKWSLYDHMDTMLWDHSACEYDGLIYISGGLESFGEPSDRLKLYDPETKAWEEKSPMPSPAYGHTMISRINYYHEGCSNVDKYLFVFNNSQEDIDVAGSVTRYNPETDQWTVYNLWVMPGKSQIVPLQDKVYYINGQGKASRVVGETEEVDIDEDGLVSGICVCLEGTIETSRYQTYKRLDGYPKKFIHNPVCCVLTLPATTLASSGIIDREEL